MNIILTEISNQIATVTDDLTNYLAHTYFDGSCH